MGRTENVRSRWVVLEVDPDHRPQLQVDEQQQDVIHADPTLAEHVDERGHRRVGGDCTDAEQRQVMKGFDAEIAERISRGMQPLAQFVSPIDVHDASSLIRLEGGCGKHMTGCLHAVKRPEAVFEKTTDCRKALKLPATRQLKGPI